MIFGWWRRRQRRKLLAKPFPAEWLAILEEFEMYRDLPPDEQARLRDLMRVFLDEKRFEGCAGLVITDEMRVLISAQACRLILHMNNEWYGRVSSILVYPAAYRQRGSGHAGSGTVTSDWNANAGESWSGGPIVLTWNTIQRDETRPHDGRNLVYHEFAHALDCLDGWADGIPPTAGKRASADWQRVVQSELAELRRRVTQGKRSLLDAYGATNEAEFFAVASECYFERPKELEQQHAELFGLLKAFYQRGA